MLHEWAFKTAVGGAWNGIAHTVVASLFSVGGAVIQGNPIGQAAAATAKGTAIVSCITGVLRSGAGYHFLENGITSDLHLTGEAAVSLLTTTFGPPVANWALNLQLPAGVVWGSVGYPNAIVAGVIYGGLALKYGYQSNWHGQIAEFLNCKVSCPSLPSMTDCCKYLPSFSIFNRSSNPARELHVGEDIARSVTASNKVQKSASRDIESKLRSYETDSKAFQAKNGLPITRSIP